jgi:hypothetical protein
LAKCLNLGFFDSSYLFQQKMGYKSITVLGAMVLAAALQGIAFLFRARSDGVFLYYVRTIQKEREKNRQDLLQKAGLVILGSGLTLVVQLAVKHLAGK